MVLRELAYLLLIGLILFVAGKWTADLIIHQSGGGVEILGVVIAAIWLGFLYSIRGRELDVVETFLLHLGHAACAAAGLWTIGVHDSVVGALVVSAAMFVGFELTQHGGHKSKSSDH